jgi:type IV pilus assembly protein PilV
MNPASRKVQSGATLIEVLVAVLIFSFGVLAVVGLQAVAIQTTSEAKFRTDASFAANSALSRIWGDPGNLSSYEETDTPISDLPGGKRSVEIDGNRVTVTIKWQSPKDAYEREFSVVGFIATNN